MERLQRPTEPGDATLDSGRDRIAVENVLVPKFSGVSLGQALLIGREVLRNHICVCPRDQIAMTIEAWPTSGAGCVRAACPYCGAFVIAAAAG